MASPSIFSSLVNEAFPDTQRPGRMAERQRDPGLGGFKDADLLVVVQYWPQVEFCEPMRSGTADAVSTGYPTQRRSCLAVASAAVEQAADFLLCADQVCVP